MPPASRGGVPSSTGTKAGLPVGFGPGARGRRRKGLAGRKCKADRWLWEEQLGLTSRISSLL